MEVEIVLNKMIFADLDERLKSREIEMEGDLEN
jgi:hypothetical protein